MAHAEEPARKRRDAPSADLEAMAFVEGLADAVDLPSLLGRIAERARSVVHAGAVLIWLTDLINGDLVLAAAASSQGAEADARVPLHEAAAAQALADRRAVWIPEVRSGPHFDPTAYGLDDPVGALVTPMAFRNEQLGVLVAFDRPDRSDSFGEIDARLLHSFAVTAATTAAVARAVESQHARRVLTAAEAERARWARELHDQTLQGLGGLKLMLDGARRHAEGALGEALHGASAHVGAEIDALRGIISDLRPAALDELGLDAALGALVERVETRSHARVRRSGTLGRRLLPEVETAAYRIVQEALTNVVRHAHAREVRLVVRDDGDRLLLEISDDGRGFDPGAAGHDDPMGTYGLVTMRERAELAGGRLDVVGSPGVGTRVTALIPLIE